MFIYCFIFVMSRLWRYIVRIPTLLSPFITCVTSGMLLNLSSNFFHLLSRMLKEFLLRLKQIILIMSLVQSLPHLCGSINVTYYYHYNLKPNSIQCVFSYVFSKKILKNYIIENSICTFSSITFPRDNVERTDSLYVNFLLSLCSYGYSVYMIYCKSYDAKSNNIG